MSSRYHEMPLSRLPRATARGLITELGVTGLTDLTDPHVHTVGITHPFGYEPVGIYAVRPLAAHPSGPVIDRALGASREHRGLCDTVAVRPDHDGPRALDSIFVGIARRAAELELDVLVFDIAEHRLAALYRRFGVDALDRPCSLGRYQVHRADNRARVARAAEALGLIDLPAAA